MPTANRSVPFICPRRSRSNLDRRMGACRCSVGSPLQSHVYGPMRRKPSGTFPPHKDVHGSFTGRAGARLQIAMSASTPSANLGRRIADVFGHFPEVLAVYLFGSVAEGRAGPHSDLDLAVVPAIRRPVAAASTSSLPWSRPDWTMWTSLSSTARTWCYASRPCAPTVSCTRARASTTAPITRAPYVILRPPPHPGDTGRSAETQAAPCLGPRSSAGACLCWKNTWPS